jgi:hypothetical protein
MGVRMATVRRLALELPGTTEEPHHDMMSFRVAGTIFATVPAEADRVHVFVGSDEVTAYCAEYPGQVEELWWGARRRGCRLPLSTADQTLLRELLTEAWRARAPKKLLADFDR